METLNPQQSQLSAAFLSQLRTLLADDLKLWWEQECEDWDALVEGVDPKELLGGEDLWDWMPVVDSKAVARTSPIFERYLGIPLDVKLIRRGGYKSIDEMVRDLVPKMLGTAAARSARVNRRRN